MFNSCVAAVWLAACVFVGSWIAWAGLSAFARVDADHLQRRCGKAGVQQVVDGFFSPLVDKSGILVCRDGRVVEAR